MTDRLVLRSPTTEDFPRFIEPLSLAFNRRQSAEETENELRTVELDRFVGALDGDAVVGCGGLLSFELTVPGGRPVPVAGVTAVGVLPTHTRQGILRRMMRWFLDQAAERHEPIAILWASEAAIYQRFGFGQSTQQTFFEAARDKIRFIDPIDPVGRVRIVDVEEALRRFPPIYEARRLAVAGSLSRTEARWRWEILEDHPWTQFGNGDKVLAILEGAGDDHGYVIYRQLAGWDTSGPKGTITTLEVVGRDPAAEQTLWQWLFGIDLIGTVRGWRHPNPHPLQLQVTEPRRLAVTLNDGLYLRILDLPAAMEARAYSGPASLVLEVTDAFQAANAGRWRLTVEADATTRAGGPVRMTRADDAEPDLALDIADLATVYLGGFGFESLRQAGRVRECRAGGVERADRAFMVPGRPSANTMF